MIISSFAQCCCSVAAAKSLQSCPTLCNPIDGGPPGSPVPGILQARTLEWVAIFFSNAWKGKLKVKSLSRVQLVATPWSAAYQALLSIGFSRQEYWSGVPLPSPIVLLVKYNVSIKMIVLDTNNTWKITYVRMLNENVCVCVHKSIRMHHCKHLLEKAMATPPVLLPGKSHGWRSLAGYSSRGCKELEITEQLHFLSHKDLWWEARILKGNKAKYQSAYVLGCWFKKKKFN